MRSNHYEVHFWNIDENSFTNLGDDEGYNRLFCSIMSILKDKHFYNNRSENIYIGHKDLLRIEFYDKIFQRIISYYKLEWYIIRDPEKPKELIISKNEKFYTERDNMLLKRMIFQEEKDYLDYIDTLDDINKLKIKEINARRTREKRSTNRNKSV